MPQSKILVALFSYNEGGKLKGLIEQFPLENNYELLFIDDGSNDGSYDFLLSKSFNIIKHNTNMGIGYGIREAIKYGRVHQFDIIVVMSANGKMLPSQIERLIVPIVNGHFDYVQGSRNLPGGEAPNLPTFRRITINLFTQIANILTGFKGTDITCGFRAYRLSLFDDKRFNLEQNWLNKYEMEYYIHYYVLKGGYRVTEAPVSMVYPEGMKNYSKIKPLIGWWSMIRPWIYLTLRIKR
ncbi:MAG: glycosyltransferase family 2 protein [candidate division Zixibacteria bacterium]|nr:glycosyltransferase family 2 protein [candidate division Zixibacteria bacterium]